MNPTYRPASLLACLALATACPIGALQEVGRGDDPNVMSMSEVVLDQYAVVNVDPDELFELTAELAGRRIFLREHGGLSSTGVDSMRQLGTTIVLYDTAEQVKKAREMLAKLDVRQVGGYDPGTESREYRPRFVSMSTARDAVQRQVHRCSSLDELGILTLQGTPAQLAAASDTLLRIDVPERQVLLTVRMLEVGGEHSGPPLPEELLVNLRKLLPESQFSQTAMAMLKTSVMRPQPISLQIESDSDVYRLTFIPTAYDEKTSSLTVSRCSLTQDIGRQGVRELFNTTTVLRGGEYTVLAATGATPRLLVVHVTPQG